MDLCFGKALKSSTLAEACFTIAMKSKAQVFELIRLRNHRITRRNRKYAKRYLELEKKSQLIPSDGFADGGCEYTDEELNS